MFSVNFARHVTLYMKFCRELMIETRVKYLSDVRISREKNKDSEEQINLIWRTRCVSIKFDPRRRDIRVSLTHILTV